MSFNLRVYGLLINGNNEVLLSDENKVNRTFTKFPGGGLEFGEGTVDCLQREFREELAIDVEVKELFYLTEHFQVSAFDKNDQVISFYYFVDSAQKHKITTKNERFDFNGEEEVHRWKSIEQLNPENFLFPIDKVVVKKLKQLS